MRYGWPLALLLIAASPASARTYSVAEVMQHHEVLNGKRVQVRGWIAVCQKLGCLLQVSPDRSEWISIGTSPSFDRAVRRYQPDAIEVVVEGIVHRECFDHSKDADRDLMDGEICVDRADELAQPQLMRVISRRKLHSSRKP